MERDDDLDSCSLLLNNKSTPLLQPGGSGSHTGDHKVVVQLSVSFLSDCDWQLVYMVHHQLGVQWHLAGLRDWLLWSTDAYAEEHWTHILVCEHSAYATLQRGMAQLPDLHVSDSSEAMLSGRKPPFRLLVRAVHAEGRRLAIRHAVSEGFVVSDLSADQTIFWLECAVGIATHPRPMALCSRAVPDGASVSMWCGLPALLWTPAQT